MAAELAISISTKENTTQGYNSLLEEFIANYFQEISLEIVNNHLKTQFGDDTIL